MVASRTGIGIEIHYEFRSHELISTGSGYQNSDQNPSHTLCTLGTERLLVVNIFLNAQINYN